MKKIYVGNLDYSVEDSDLSTAFSPYGEVVSATVIKDKFSGRSRGFGFVEMSTEEAMNESIEKINKTELKGRTLFVSVAKESEPRTGGGNGGGGFKRSGGGGGGFGGPSKPSFNRRFDRN